ncbi:MAG TPA: N,N-dimethylformamidase beta subunit family domain-containing protein [Baekduia sp.]|nr:N,N-dimethylformamidase beta subunit family domain-containing protein [Baekduia sp.]
MSAEPTNPGWPPGVMGYVDRPSAAPGETVAVHVSTDAAATWTADLVRLLSADLAPEGPPFREAAVEAVPAVEREALVQPTPVGSYGHAPAHPRLSALADGLTITLEVAPTLLHDGRQTIVAHGDPAAGAGLALVLDDDVLTAAVAGATVSAGQPVTAGCWYRVTIAITGEALSLVQEPIGTREANRFALRPDGDTTVTATAPAAPVGAPAAAPLLFGAATVGADGVPQGCFTGRLGPITLTAPGDDAPLAHWDPAAGIGRDGVATPSRLDDRGPLGLHATLVNRPLRGVTGSRWDGTQHDLRHAPEQYTAVHFHRDDLSDCAWTPQWDLALPAELESGVYAVRVRAGAHEDRIPFVVRPPRGAARADRADVLFVLPTNSYLAYANDHVATDSPRVQMLMRRVPQLDELEVYRHAHREFGSSLYEVHADGSPIALSTWRRPILTMRPHVHLFNARAWQFTGDLQLVDWLDRAGRRVDVVADIDVHREGAALLSRYRCVMTGSHPEYVTGPMLDAFEGYVAGGGRFLYLGGNGLYWVTGYDPEDDNIVEIRRWGGTEAWTAAPGEYHLASTGEMGGLWRNRGRAPQKLTGIGFIAQGLDAASGYRARADADPRAGWVLDGVDDELFGLTGTLGGAAGMEIDAVDATLGTPHQTVIVATSEGHSDDMLLAREAVGMTSAAPGGARNPRVHADLVLVPWPGGGGVFAPGSITWAASLADAEYDGPISKIMNNVLDRFVSGAPLLEDA